MSFDSPDDRDKSNSDDDQGRLRIVKKKKKDKDKGYKMFEADISDAETNPCDDGRGSGVKLKKHSLSFKFSNLKKDGIFKKEKEEKQDKERDPRKLKESFSAKSAKKRDADGKPQGRKHKKDSAAPAGSHHDSAAARTQSEHLTGTALPPGHAEPVFGVPLATAVERHPPTDGILLPVIVRECIDYVEEHGLLSEGIYRVSGVKSKVQQLRDAYNRLHTAQSGSSAAGGSLCLYEHDPSVVASLLKQYLRELPEPVLTVHLIPAFEEAAAAAATAAAPPGTQPETASSVSAAVLRLKSLIGQLPECNRLLLSWMMVHMVHVVAKEKINKMSMQNVSIVLSPTMQISHRVLNAFFIHAAVLFGDVQLVRYVRAVKSSVGNQPSESGETTSSLEDELRQQEALLSQLHAAMQSAGRRHRGASDDTEERLWEVQRSVTQLKRKLKLAQKTMAAREMEQQQHAGSAAAATPISAAQPGPSDMTLNFALQSPRSLSDCSPQLIAKKAQSEGTVLEARSGNTHRNEGLGESVRGHAASATAISLSRMEADSALVIQSNTAEDCAVAAAAESKSAAPEPLKQEEHEPCVPLDSNSTVSEPPASVDGDGTVPGPVKLRGPKLSASVDSGSPVPEPMKGGEPEPSAPVASEGGCTPTGTTSCATHDGNADTTLSIPPTAGIDADGITDQASRKATSASAAVSTEGLLAGKTVETAAREEIQQTVDEHAVSVANTTAGTLLGVTTASKSADPVELSSSSLLIGKSPVDVGAATQIQNANEFTAAAVLLQSFGAQNNGPDVALVLSQHALLDSCSRGKSSSSPQSEYQLLTESIASSTATDGDDLRSPSSPSAIAVDVPCLPARTLPEHADQPIGVGSQSYYGSAEALQVTPTAAQSGTMFADGILLPEKLHHLPANNQTSDYWPLFVCEREAADDEELHRLIAEEALLIWEEEELLAIKDELHQKIATEQLEAERLRDEIAEYEELRSIRQRPSSSSAASSAGSNGYIDATRRLSSHPDSLLGSPEPAESSASSDDDSSDNADSSSGEDSYELVEQLEQLNNDNRRYEEENCSMVQKIHEERLVCLGVKLQIRLLQQQQLGKASSTIPSLL